MQTKQCSKCNETKPVSEFSKAKRGKYGVRGQCKVCQYQYKKQWLQTERGKEVHKKAQCKYEQTEKGKEAKRKAARKYRQSINGKEVYRKARRTRRAKKAGVFHFPYTINELQKHWLMVGIKPNKCYYCEERKFEHVDHYVPIDLNGPDAPFNVVPSCACCNQSKGAKLHQEFIMQSSLK